MRAEQVGRIFVEGGRPDILIEKPDGWPVVLEAEVGNHGQAEAEAKSRLGNRLVSTGALVHVAVALVYPEELRHLSGAALRDALKVCSLEYAFFTVESDDSISRFPNSWVDIYFCLRIGRSTAPLKHSRLVD